MHDINIGATIARERRAAHKVLLKADGLTFQYASHEVFADVSLRMHAGEMAFLVGVNGSGKSTLLRCLAGWDAPRKGSIELLGKPFDGVNRAQRRLMSFVPDVPVFYDDLTAEEHIRFVLAANHAPEDAHTYAFSLLDTFGLKEFSDQYPSSYSRGMRQKLALVLALMARPRLLLLDEPYGPLDPQAARELSALLSRACKEDVAVLMSCHHDVPDMKPDQVLRLEYGRLAQDGEGSVL